MREDQHTWGDRVVAALLRGREASRRRRAGRRPAARVLTAAVCAVAAFLIVLSTVNARGSDLRPGRNTDLTSLVADQSRRNTDLTRQVTDLRTQVDALAAAENEANGSGLSTELERQEQEAGLTPVIGPAVSVTLNDAPSSVAANGVDADLLVVHQQDIQSVVNALWSGGAEAMTIQGQRVISTTGIKCVGNTVVLHGVPYAPPYVISAIGDQGRLETALATSTSVQIYRQYVDAYGLVYDEGREGSVTFPAHEGSLDLQHAQPLDSSASPR
ncbi:Uncharacterized conserved protein YlxW, UPF0749 family [Microlunatus sagamiharensis]|uniref:Uncharacterized conserved protein YlxW, UPF0749 family n=1 Tax=Microlunatus sagamiharensis TaxID=546874 RepID=A0A1H2N4Y4_9ACTN|nr:DUF881 domain-containing protein [Microlunatus sagamiharensis]SDV00530.1 Uncharacterized conserved protein YlxW, UPF0749 family [Microlunatus sagamiharensis]